MPFANADAPLPPDAPGVPPHVHESLLQLRARAEKRRQLVTQAADPHTPEETQRLVQELQVHQIELEMQYEELLLAQAQAESARLQYLDLYDFAPVSYFTLSETGTVEQLNLRASQQLGSVRRRLVGRRFTLFVAPGHRLEFGQFLARVFQSDRTQSTELRLQREDGTPFVAQLEGLRAAAATTGAPQCRIAVLDATARHEATAALAASEARFRKLFFDSHDAVALLQGHYYVECNPAALRLLGATAREQVVGQVAWAHAPEHQPDGVRTVDLFRDSVDEALRTGSKRCLALMHKLSGEAIWMEAVLTPIEPDGARPLVHVLWRNVTAARAAQQELRQAKEFTEGLLENAVDGIMALDREGRITAWNARMHHYYGLSAAEALGRPLFEVMPHLGEAARRDLHRALAGKHVVRYGQVFPAGQGRYDVNLVPLPVEEKTAQPSGVLVLIHDVTERDRLAEETTQLRLRQQQEVLMAILTTQESERKRIAEGLHNGVGQLLYATKLSLESRNGAPAQTRKSLRLLEEAIRTTRTISFELTPGILQDFGLRTGLEEFVKRIAPTGLPVRLHLTELDERLPPPVEIAVYRIVQELLNNVMKHAQATEVEVHVAREGHRLEVSVEDNGIGFEPDSLNAQPLAGIGLAGVRNRVALLGGVLSVNSRLGRGTIVSFELDV